MAELFLTTTTTLPSPPKIVVEKPLRLTVADKTLGSTANLVKLLPCGTVIAFQALSPSFTNSGSCYTSNMFLTGFLIALLTLSCCFFSFTDSFVGQNGKVYFGIATFRGFYVFNYDCSEMGDGKMGLEELGKYRIRVIDFIHALFSCLVFLALTLGDSNVQNCFFRGGGMDAKELLVNLPIGIGFLSSLVFVIFPSSRKGIGYSDNSQQR